MPHFANELTEATQDFILNQHMFFTGSAPSGGRGRVNVSPKGMDTFRIISDSEVAYLDLTGSGNETAAHTRENGRLTIMFCSFAPPPDGKPLILRLYGRGETIQPGDTEWNELIRHFPSLPGTRQIVRLNIETVQTSCGFGVPTYEFLGHREMLTEWACRKGEESLRTYREANNRLSIDGLETGLRVPMASSG